MWHDEAYIVGTREGLEMLRIAIDHALANEYGQMETYTCDGEGYTVYVVTMIEKQINAMPVPYTNDIAVVNKEWEKFLRLPVPRPADDAGR